MRKGLKRKTYQNLPSLICVEFCPYLGSNHRHHDLKESAETKLVAIWISIASFSINFEIPKPFRDLKNSKIVLHANSRTTEALRIVEEAIELKPIRKEYAIVFQKPLKFKS
jgi:hypothetical protein